MWILLLVVLILLAALTTILFLVPITRWYVLALMAKFDFVFTNVPESYFKEVVRFGGHRKTLLSKVGYKIDRRGSITRLAPGELPEETSFPGGLRVVGLPFIDRIYKREMEFSKSLPNGEIKAYDVKNVDKFYARVDYPYALPFVKCEDKNNLPLLGHATLLAQVVNPTKSLFATANFYDTMIGLVLPSVRECLKGFTFDEIKLKDDLDEIIWTELNAPNPEEPRGVIGKLRDKYGVVIVAFRIVNIDPPEAYRDITLTKWKAEREADAAGAIARKQAEETEGRVMESVARASGMTRKDLEEAIAADPTIKGLPASEGGLREDFAHARDLLKRDRAGSGLDDIRVGNVDGTPLEPGIATIAALFGLGKRSGRKTSGGSTGSSKRGGKKKDPKDMDDDELFDDLPGS